MQIQIIKKRGRPTLLNMNRDKTTGRSRGEAVESIIATALLPRLKSGITYEESIVRDIRTGKVVGSNQDAGHVLGRLKMVGPGTAGGISLDQFLAGEQYAQIVHSFSSIMGLPSPNPKSCNLHGAGGASLTAEPTPETVERIKLRYARCTEALNEAGFEMHQGNRVAKITNAVCMDRIEFVQIHGDMQYIGSLRVGLNAISRALRK